MPIEFVYESKAAEKVELSGGFLYRHNGRMPLSKGPDGLWTTTVYLHPGTYRYSFVVDGQKIPDPRNSVKLRGSSVFTVPETDDKAAKAQ